MNTPQFLDKAPVETYPLSGRRILVYRADLVPQPPLAPYLKMIELYPFLKGLSQRYKVMGYYAVPESEWVEAVPPLAASVGVKAIIGISQTKKMPEYAGRMPEENLYKLTPNMYKVNFSRTKKHVESLGGFMAPMGLDCWEVVNGLQTFLVGSPLPEVDNYLIPVGSGVALSGILNHLAGHGRVFGICTRPVASVEKVVKKYVKDKNYLLLQNEPTGGEGPFPMHRFWDLNAWHWLCDNVSKLKGSVCFVNLGSGKRES